MHPEHISHPLHKNGGPGLQFLATAPLSFQVDVLSLFPHPAGFPEGARISKLTQHTAPWAERVAISWTWVVSILILKEDSNLRRLTGGGRKMFQDEPETKESHDHRGCILFNSQCDTHSLPVIMWSTKRTPFDLMAHSPRGFVRCLLGALPVYPRRDGPETVTDPALWLRVPLS